MSQFRSGGRPEVIRLSYSSRSPITTFASVEAFTFFPFRIPRIVLRSSPVALVVRRSPRALISNDLRSRDSLAADLMEPARPRVDELLLKLLTSEQMRREWFFEQRDGNCRLMAPFAAMLSETGMMWRKEVASYAEWIAKSIWGSKMKPKRTEDPATRLTQRQRSEGRAKLAGLDETKSPSSLALCRICGQIRLGSNGVCRDCA